MSPSGIFSHRYLRWAVEVLGAERILMSTDYPFEKAPPASVPRFLDQSGLRDADRALIAHANWDRLVARIRR